MGKFLSFFLTFNLLKLNITTHRLMLNKKFRVEYIKTLFRISEMNFIYHSVEEVFEFQFTLEIQAQI